MEELTKHGTYVAGFLDHSIHGRTDLYDLFVNGENFSCVIIIVLSVHVIVCVLMVHLTLHAVPEASLTVAPHAKGIIIGLTLYIIYTPFTILSCTPQILS